MFSVTEARSVAHRALHGLESYTWDIYVFCSVKGCELSLSWSHHLLGGLSTTDHIPIPSLLSCRAPSPSGLMSPSRLPGSRDRDWENGSNASSPASVPEYTGEGGTPGGECWALPVPSYPY